MTKTTTKVVNTVSRCRCRNWETGAGILRHLPIAYLVRGDPELQGSQCSWLHTQGSSAASHWNKLRISRQAFPGGPVVKNLPWRRRGYGFHPWSGKIPHAAGQLCPCATAAEPLSCSHWSLHILEPVLCHKRRHGDEKHEHGGWRVFPPPPRPPHPPQPEESLSSNEEPTKPEKNTERKNFQTASRLLNQGQSPSEPRTSCACMGPTKRCSHDTMPSQSTDPAESRGTRGVLLMCPWYSLCICHSQRIANFSWQGEWLYFQQKIQRHL